MLQSANFLHPSIRIRRCQILCLILISEDLIRRIASLLCRCSAYGSPGVAINILIEGQLYDLEIEILECYYQELLVIKYFPMENSRCEYCIFHSLKFYFTIGKSRPFICEDIPNGKIKSCKHVRVVYVLLKNPNIFFFEFFLH